MKLMRKLLLTLGNDGCFLLQRLLHSVQLSLESRPDFIDGLDPSCRLTIEFLVERADSRLEVVRHLVDLFRQSSVVF